MLFIFAEKKWEKCERYGRAFKIKIMGLHSVAGWKKYSYRREK